MSQPFIGEIRAFGFQFAPSQWAFCDGQLMAISQNDALFSILGTTFGGDGVSTFGMPNLQGRVPMHWGTGSGLTTDIGQVQGQPLVTLTTAQTPQHTHVITVVAEGAGGIVEKTPNPGPTRWLATSNPDALWVPSSPTINDPFAGNAISSVGGSQPHDNMQPYLAINFCISLYGIYPSRN